MQNNTGKPNQSTPTKQFRNVALQSTRFSSFQDPMSAQQPQVPQRSVNTQTIYPELGIGSTTSTSDINATTRGPKWSRRPTTTAANPNFMNPVLVKTAASPPNPTTNSLEQRLIVPGVIQSPIQAVPGQTQIQPPIQVVPGQTQIQPRIDQKPFGVPKNQNVIRIPLQNTVPGTINGGGQIDQTIKSNQLNLSNRMPMQNKQNDQFQQLELARNPYGIFEQLFEENVVVDQKWDLLGPLKNILDADLPPQCPEGFEVLLDTENIFVQHAEADFTEAFFNIHNKYDILNTYGERIYFSGETLNSLARPNCAGAQRFKLSIIGCQGGEVFYLRGKNFTALLRTRDKQIIGSICTSFQWCDNFPSYKIMDSNQQLLYQLYHEMGNKNTYDYEIFDKDMDKIGRMSKTWIGLPYPDSDLPYSYGISFPPDTDVKKKSLLMGALFVAYFQYFEDTQKERRYNRDAFCATMVSLVVFVLIMIGLAFTAAFIVMH